MRFILFLPLLFFSCKTSNVNLFGSKNYHEQYGKKISDAGLKETALGKAWFAAAERATTTPQSVNIPYKEMGYFAPEKPRAVGLAFAAKRGEKIHFEITKKSAATFTLYTDLWKLNEQNQPSLISSIDTAQTTFTHEVDRDGKFILRFQPELLSSGDYTLTISIGPTLAYPVGDRNAKIGSFWGADRDAGRRKHEGIDIFAPRGTPAVAAADGTITSVSENTLGGKVIFMRPTGKDIHLYYAHLDQQTVSSGARVKAGDKIGTVGNTGNAATTSPHLHFGIYTFGGAIDPLPFVNQAIKKPAEVKVDVAQLPVMRLKNEFKFGSATYKAQTIAYPLAATEKEYRVELPDGTIADIPVSSLQPYEGALKQLKIKNALAILDIPTAGAATKAIVEASTNVSVMGYYDKFTYIKTAKGAEGWVENALL